MLTGNGLIVIIAGYLEQQYGDKTKAWSYTMIIIGLIMAVITIYNYFFTPKTETKTIGNELELTPKVSFGTVFSSFFQKKQIGLALAFILFFRLGESQLLKMLTPFLIDEKSVGGMGLTTQDVGIIYGTFGVLALTIGGILGGIAISKQGLGKWMLPMILTMHLPIIGFILLSHFHPESIFYVYATVIAEQFGYGFGFAAFMMYLIYIADGESKTSHYSIATGFMALGMMLPGMLSGYIQEYLGYTNFFVWVFLATIPGLILSRFLIFPKDFGKKSGA
jgi:PAT family beta-lactamase induction signal transducer AmpG